ncbi:hypothetical protein P4H94_22065, partial [Paenibacillus macerans]
KDQLRFSFVAVVSAATFIIYHSDLGFCKSFFDFFISTLTQPLKPASLQHYPLNNGTNANLT